MKLGIVADAHGNAAAFDRALGELASEADALLVAGDAFSDHRFSNDIVRAIREAEALYVLGNHELSFLGPGGVRARESARVSRTELAYVEAASTELRCTIGGLRLLMVHGSPFPPYARYVDPESTEFERAGELDADLVVLGHTHLPMARRVGPTLIVNPGSVGMSDQPARGEQVGYAMVDTDSGEVTFRSFDNPRRAAV
ncbi:metallophosphatase family protein [Pseudonocardia sp. RS11V-5]|uniref:metallophosphoesterase family protein n=1 Tax=Pseudonocardia terrae TaxID=2905831 RepID=UPI001E5A7FC0|nr:YfcE family phosphodiesterase [Pseudonocardia terrae]MCE3550831.1 metallophosphatase family protein [Pseudonocardia terrae]